MIEKDEDVDLIQRYRACYEKIAQDDLKSPLECIRSRRRRFVSLKQFMGDTQGKLVLDIGSGPGNFLQFLNGKKIAFDLSLTYLKTAKGKGLECILGDAEHLPFKKSTIDVIVCMDVLEHVLGPEKVCREIKEIMKNDSKAYIVIPYKEDLSRYKMYEGTYEFTHLRSFDELNISELLKDFHIINRKGIIPRIPQSAEFRLNPKIYLQGKLGSILSEIDSRLFHKFLSLLLCIILAKFLERRIGLLLFPPVHFILEITPRN